MVADRDEHNALRADRSANERDDSSCVMITTSSAGPRVQRIGDDLAGDAAQRDESANTVARDVRFEKHVHERDSLTIIEALGTIVDDHIDPRRQRREPLIL